MSFLNAIFLFALPLIGLPVLLHLFRRRQRNVIHWGAMEFLTDAVTKGRRWERLEELLLMLLRVAALLVLVFALARPLVRGYWLGVAPAREVVLVIDNSLSTARRTDRGLVFDEVRERAMDILDDLSAQDAVQLVLAAAGPSWLTPESVSATGAAVRKLKETIRELQPTRASADMFSCLQAVIDAESSGGTLTRRIIVLTDLQAFGWQTDAEAAWQRLQQMCENSAVPASVEVLHCGKAEAAIANLTIARLDAKRTLVSPDEPVSLTAEVKNCGDSPLEQHTLEWYVDDEQVGTYMLPPLARDASQSIPWSYRPTDKGTFSIRCQLKGNDDLELDNEEGIVVEVVDEIPILVVADSETLSESNRLSGMRFFTTALGFLGEEPQGNWQSIFKPDVIGADDLETLPLAEYSAIVMLGVPRLTDSTFERLHEFANEGGGIWLMLSAAVDRDAFNAAWYDEGAGISPLPIAELVDDASRLEAARRIHPPQGDHPATIHLADTERLDIDNVEVSRHFRFEKDARPEVSVLLESGTGEPLVVEHYLGRGRAIVQAFPIDYAWSDLPRSKAYVVMVQDWLTYLTRPAATRYNLPAGGSIVWRPPSELAGADATIITPSGDSLELSPLEQDGGPVFRFSQTDIPGPYQLQLTQRGEQATVVPFRVPRDSAESELTLLDAEQQAALTELGGLQFVSEIKRIASDMPQVPNEKPIWWPLLVTLLVLLVAELLLATVTARQRYLAAPLTVGT